MKRLACLLALIGCVFAAAAQDTDDFAAERRRLAAGHARVDSEFKAEEKACYGKFGVNDCLSAARAKRRLATADLRRQEVSINDAERRRKAAGRQSTLDARVAAERQRQQAEQVERAAQGREREVRAEEKAARAAQAASAAAAPSKAAAHAAQVERRKAEHDAAQAKLARDAQRKQAQHEERLEAAQERREKLDKRLAERKKPPAQPLPVPP